MVLVMLAGWLAYTESMPPCATGLERSTKAITPTTMATTTSAMTTGTAGGRLRLGLSNSSVMGTCPASYCGLGGVVLSAMNHPPDDDTRACPEDLALEGARLQ